MTTTVMALIITFFFADGHTEQEKRELYVPVCGVFEGERVEDATCGVRYCLGEGAEIAEFLHPNTTYVTQCIGKEE